MNSIEHLPPVMNAPRAIAIRLEAIAILFPPTVTVMNTPRLRHFVHQYRLGTACAAWIGFVVRASGVNFVGKNTTRGVPGFIVWNW